MSDGPSSRIRYSSTAVAALVSTESRSFLERQGLPKEHLLFAAYASEEVSIEHLDKEGEFLCVGELGDYERLCINLQTGFVVEIHQLDSSVWYINKNITKFSKSLEIFAERFPFYEVDAEFHTMETAADEFKVALLEVDDTALCEDPGFWYTILHDIALGDYADE